MNKLPSNIPPLLCLVWHQPFTTERQAKDHAFWTASLGASIDRIGDSRRFVLKVICRKPARWRKAQIQCIRQTPGSHERHWRPMLFLGYDDVAPILHPLMPEQADDYAADPETFLQSFTDDDGELVAGYA